MRREMLAVMLVTMLIPSAFAFSIADLFKPILAAVGIVQPTSDGMAPLIDSFKVVSQPYGPGRAFTVELCVVTIPFNPQPAAAEFAIDNTSNVVKTVSFTPDTTKSITCRTYSLAAPSTSGTHTVYARVRDAEGDWSSWESDTFEVPGTNPPQIVSVSAPSTVTAGESFTVTVHATDEDGDIRLIGISIGDYSESREVDGGDETVTFTVPGLSEGTYTLTAYAQDNYNNKDTETRTIRVTPAYTGPSVTVSVDPETVNVGDSVTISASAEGEGLKNITISVNGRVIKNQDCRGGDVCAVSVQYAPTSAGTYAVKATVYDTYGNSDSDTAEFTAEESTTCTCTPHVSLSVSPTDVDTGESVKITANGYVSYSGNCKYEPLATRIRIYIDGQMVTNFDCGAPYSPECTKGPVTITHVFDTPGDHTIKAQMVWDDCNGATRDDAWSNPVTVHVSGSISPTIKISADKTELAPGESVTFTAEGRANAIKSIDIVVDGVTRRTQNCGLDTSCTVTYTTSFQSGEHSAYAILRYVENGNVYTKQSATVTVKVNTTPPPATVSISAEKTTLTVGESTTLTAIASSSAGIQHIVIYVDGAAVALEHCDGATTCSATQVVNFDTVGEHTAYARAYYGPNAAYQKDSATITINVLPKNAPPTVYKLDGYSVTYTDVPYTVEVCARDSDGKVVKIEAWMDNREHKSVIVDSSDVCRKITLYAPLTVGKHTVYARAEDNGGAWSEIASKTFTAIPRNAAPTATISAPTKVSPGNIFDFRVCGKDADGKIVQVAARVGSADWQYKTPDSEGCAEFIATAPSSPATLTVYGKVKDDDGAWSSEVSAKVVVAYSAPAIVKFDLPSMVYVGREFNVIVSARDVDNDLDRAELVIKKGTTVVGRWSKDLPETGGTTEFKVSVNEAGDYTATVTVYDKHGLSTSQSKSFSAVLPPNEPPVVDSVKVIGPVYVDEPFEMNVCAHDPDGNVEWITYAIEGGAQGAYRVGTNGCHVITVPAPGVSAPGTYEMNVWAIDYQRAKSKPFRTAITVKERDTTPPRVAIVGVQDTNVPGRIYLHVFASDNVGLDDANVYYRLEGTANWILAGRYDLTGPEYAFVASVPANTPGEYNIMVVVSDTSGNKGVAYAVGRAVDEIPPTIVITAPSEVNQGQEFQFSVSVTDNYRIFRVLVTVDGNWLFAGDYMDVATWSKTFTYAFPHASEHNIAVSVGDYYGNGARAIHTITVHPVDTNAPVIDLNAWYDENTNDIVWNVYASDPNLKDVNVYVNGDYVGSCDVENGEASCSGSYLVESAGDYVVKVVAADAYGNVAEKSVTVTIGDEPPILDISAPATVPVGGTATIHVQASDDWGLAHIEINGFGIGVDENISGREFIRDFNVLLPEEGNYTYTITVMDTAGQSVSRSVTVEATREGHTYDLVLTGYSGTTARVVIQGKIDGSIVDLHCSDVVVNIEPADTETPMGSYTVHDITVDGHSACEVTVTGTGKYIVRATWMGVTKGTVVTVFAESVAAPESAVVALVLGLIALGLLGRFI